MGVDAVMHVVVRGRVMTPAEVLDASKRLTSVHGADPFALWRDSKDGKPRHALVILSRDPNQNEYAIEHDETFADYRVTEADTLLEVRLVGHYYGPHYERGDVYRLCGIADSVERIIPNAEVWYGGDCDTGLTRFDAAARNGLLDHAVNVYGRKPYVAYRGAFRENEPCRVLCDLCGGEEMERLGWGNHNKYAVYTCPTCEFTAKTTDGGATWQEESRVGGTDRPAKLLRVIGSLIPATA
jgi:hypothetical protein